MSQIAKPQSSEPDVLRPYEARTGSRIELRPAARSACNQIANLTERDRGHDCGSSSVNLVGSRKGCLGCGDGTRLDQSRLLLGYPLQHFRCWFILRVLRHEFAADGEVEDGLAELLDLVGAGGEGGEGVEGEAGVAGEGCASGSGALRRARLAAVSRSRVASRFARAASSRSHSAINSSTLATMRCCSARGGRGSALKPSPRNR